MISHEIRAPLNAVMGFSELLADAEISAADRTQYAGLVKSNGEVLIRLIDDILDLAKIEAGEMQVEMVDVNFHELMSDIRSLMEFIAARKGISFSLTLSERVPQSIHTDPIRLRQVLINIIGNAVKFTVNGTVNVVVSLDKVETKQNLIRIMVRDTGEGIEPDRVAELFQPYHQVYEQAEAAISRRCRGTGLGLVLARRLAQILGGGVELMESTPGVGSVFEVTLNCEAAQAWQSSGSAENQDEFAHRLDHFQILLVEDVADNQLLMKTILTPLGATVEIAANGGEAVEKALAGSFDLVLMDLQMPILDGFEATARLRHQGYQGPIVALTAHAMGEEIKRCYQAGCNAHLGKPFKRREFMELIDRLGVRPSSAPGPAQTPPLA